MNKILIISGFPKCRTTYYYEKVLGNPSFKNNSKKELRFSFKKNTFQDYIKLLKKHNYGKYYIDSSPEYIYDSNFIDIINNNKNICNIILVRDPIERLRSVLNFKKYTIGDLKFDKIDDVITDYKNNGNNSPYYSFLERSMYEKYCWNLKSNSYIFNDNDEEKIFTQINKFFNEKFIYADIVVKNKNQTSTINPIVRYIFNKIGTNFPRFIKDYLSFLKKPVKKEEFSDQSIFFLQNKLKNTYQWIKLKL